MTTNIFYSHSHVEQDARESLLKQKGCVLWFTGLSGSGKSTIAKALELALIEQGQASYILDGDNIRHGLNSDLGFSKEDRVENLRRIGQVASLFADAGFITITAFISPYREDRQKVRDLLPEGRFIEVFINTPLAICEERDPKGLYKKARNNEIKEFTGIDAPYEAPDNPELDIQTAELDIDQAVTQIINYLKKGRLITP